ncbi:glass bottom boat protein precursor [Tribolium castaneum]|uniref:Protein 60A n=1 Tax=Tribolium castaneum TaxID=7070 RepID=D6WJG3_TRICA|nr:glass bottom boat protein precursor [Tribolium castaneum]EFA04645.1 glass bottom boat [Tribolium castaneum]|eukprot:NP_001107813.1 glass bottom boat protein precursor [Tribolium castaneum]
MNFVLVLSLVLGEALCWSKAGIYIDNGLNQTVIDREMTTSEKQEMEMEILNLLGLPERPKRVSNSLKRSAPKFLLDIYKSLMEEENEGHSRSERSADLNLSGDEQNAIDESDVIMTFESINHHVSSVRHERGKRLWFNVSEMPIAENVVGAELRIYQKEIHSPKKARNVYTVTVFELVNTDSGERELEYISAVNTTGSFTGWLNLNLTACLPTWVAFPDSNKGLYLSVHPVDKPGREIRPEDIGLITVKGEDETQPFMVAFLKASNHVQPKRSIRDLSSKRRVRKSNYVEMMLSDNPHYGSTCKMYDLYISFKDLKWQDWIIAPAGYSAHYCAGECKFPLNGHMNATNHAIVQTLVHLMYPNKYPKPCCAPTKLTPISVLYFQDDTNVILKKYKKMSVKSCGCH